jgi:hypothetical protein
MLYVIAERYPPAQKYRDVFDRIKMNVNSAISQGKTRATGILDTEMTERCRALNQGLSDTVRTDYTQIISDLAKDERKIELEVGLNIPDAGASGQVRQYGHTPHFDFSMASGSMIDYGHTLDPAFMYDLGDPGLSSLVTTNWDQLDS